MEKMKILCSQIIVAIVLTGMAPQIASAQQRKPFTVIDEIGLTLFDSPGGPRAEVQFSPDGNYFAVWSERGNLGLNRVEDSLHFYRRQDVEAYLKSTDITQPVSPIWIVTRSAEEGIVINNWRWLPDSKGVAFLEGNGGFGDKRLVLADLRRKVIEPLTPITEAVRTFHVRDRENYVYTAFDRAERDALVLKTGAEPRVATTIATGQSLIELIFHDDKIHKPTPLCRLWAVTGGKRLEFRQDLGNTPELSPGGLALSPDGSSVITILPVREFPPSWETLYPPPFASYPFRIRRNEPVHQYVRINLHTGSIKSLTDAPLGPDAGWGGAWAESVGPSWSNDGLAALLPGTFLSSPEQKPAAPCVAVVDFTSVARTCVASLKGTTDEKGYHFLLVAGASFVGEGKNRVVVTTYDGSYHTKEYERASGNSWQLVPEGSGQPIEGRSNDLEVLVKEGLDQPPLLVARSKQVTRVIWDPNPQLDRIELGDAGVYKWKDNEGREWEGGLYKPVGYKPGKRYPLVIQTHGFQEFQFRPSGLFPTGSAARALAAAGIFVLQIGEGANCLGQTQTPSEGPCAVAGYESAVKQLVSEGDIDPERVGIIGFSRSCYWVLTALTASSVHFKAALVTDGWMMTYFEYISTVDYHAGSPVPRQFDTVIGASPFGEGLQQWLKRSPGFNLDKITAPLLVAAEGPVSLFEMWDVYAGLRYLHKPTDLILLNTDEHVLTNPAMRLASQGGSVDWFRFWLKGEEDADPSKSEQYARWEKLLEMCAIGCRAQSQ